MILLPSIKAAVQEGAVLVTHDGEILIIEGIQGDAITAHDYKDPKKTSRVELKDILLNGAALYEPQEVERLTRSVREKSQNPID